MDPSTDVDRLEALVTTMSARMAQITRTLGRWVQHDVHDLQRIEEHVLGLVKEVGATLVAGLCSLAVPAQPVDRVPCPCGHTAHYQRQRAATVTTILGPITVQRPYYLCPACRQGQHPLDRQFQLCAGSRSAGLDEVLALLGATQDSFAEAASVLERLTLVHVSPNTVRDATEQLGADLVTVQAQAVVQASAGQTEPAQPSSVPHRLYVTMDGVLAHLHDRGWTELKVGCCYQTCSRPARRRPEQVELRAQQTGYVTALVEAQTFGWHLWQEAARQGVVAADEVVVVGDGAHWIWNIAETHFPTATQIVDWYHASEYLWEAATAIWGEQQAEREAWAHQQLDRLWESRVAEVLTALGEHAARGAGVTAAISYYTTHQGRMDYAAYRARGLQIGSGNVESACKQLVSARLKQAGMIWEAAGAERVAVVRAWLKSERWAEAMALRTPPGRHYHRQPVPTPAPVAGTCPSAPRPPVGGLPLEVLETIRTEQSAAPGVHPWRRAWSVKQQRVQSAAHTDTVRAVTTA